MMDEPCKGCRASVRLAPAPLRQLLDESLLAHPQPTADEPTVAARLAACRACPDLRYGTTCQHCGCLVEIRAHLAAGCCPSPGGSRWPT